MVTLTTVTLLLVVALLNHTCVLAQLQRLAANLLAGPKQVLPGPTSAVLRPPSDHRSETLILIIDRSSSMGCACGSVNRLDAAIEASEALLNTRLRLETDDQVAVVAFDEGAVIVHPLVSLRANTASIIRALNGIRYGGGTDLNCPLVLVKQLLNESRSHRAHIVMLTDGQGGHPVGTSKQLKQSGAIIETIGVGNIRSDVDEPLLKKVASVVNDRILYRFIHDREELVQYFTTQVAGRLVK